MPDGRFVATYVNFDHRRPDYYTPYNNIQPSAEFRRTLAEHFIIEKQFPTSHNWNGSEPGKWFVRIPNMYVSVNVPMRHRPAGGRIHLHLQTPAGLTTRRSRWEALSTRVPAMHRPFRLYQEPDRKLRIPDRRWSDRGVMSYQPACRLCAVPSCGLSSTSACPGMPESGGFHG